ncbi:MAG: hypothetical protein LBJ48_01120, partial [Coriobacteriales bacterium]|nr:hypothetical protein [Coriobacteriales bacterium]
HQTDARTDVYNLGATMYHLVTGHNPSEPPYVMHPIRQWDPSLSSGLEAIIVKCTRRDPADRYQSMAELLFDLERYQQLDYAYIKGQNRKWVSFLAAAVATLVFTAGSLGLATAEGITRQNSYDAFVTRAEQDYGSSLDAALDNYIQATKLDASRGEAYESLITLIGRDGVMDDEESIDLRTLLGDTTGGGTNRELLASQNPVASGEVEYGAGILYYFIYNGYGDKNAAANYLENAAASATLLPSEQEIARLLAQISRNYDRIINGSGGGMGSLIPNEDFTVNSYWQTLMDMSEGDLQALTGNSRIVIEVYRDVVYQIAQHSDVFIKGGISLAQITTLLDNAERGLEGVSPSDAEDRALVEETLENLEVARQRAQTTAENNSYSGNSSSRSGASEGAGGSSTTSSTTSATTNASGNGSTSGVFRESGNPRLGGSGGGA